MCKINFSSFKKARIILKLSYSTYFLHVKPKYRKAHKVIHFEYLMNKSLKRKPLLSIITVIAFCFYLKSIFGIYIYEEKTNKCLIMSIKYKSNRNVKINKERDVKKTRFMRSS